MPGPIDRKAAAERLLSDDLIVEARAHMRDTLSKALWRRHALPPADQARLDAMVAHYDAFWSWLERVITDGKMAEMDEAQKSMAAQAMDAMRKKLLRI
jgi:phage terminase small subunit